MPDVRPIDATALQNTISEWRKKEMENDNSNAGSSEKARCDECK